MQYIIQRATLEQELLNISVLFIVLRKKILMVEKQTFFRSYLYEISRPLAFSKIFFINANLHICLYMHFYFFLFCIQPLRYLHSGGTLIVSIH